MSNRRTKTKAREEEAPRRRQGPGPVPATPPSDEQLCEWLDKARSLARKLGGQEWEETAERALFLLELEYLHGSMPRYVSAWLRKVILSLFLKRKLRQGGLTFEDTGTLDRRGAANPEPERSPRIDKAWAALRSVLEPQLTKRQCAVFMHLPTAETMKELARSSGTTPRDARNILWEIVVKARRLLARESGTATT